MFTLVMIVGLFILFLVERFLSVRSGHTPKKSNASARRVSAPRRR
jgi:hypothetical protein